MSSLQSACKQFIASLVLIWVSTGFALANDPKTMVEEAANGLAAAIMKDKPKVEKDAQHIADLIENHIIPIVDQELFAKLSLGKNHWESANAKQKDDFILGFKKMLVKSYAGAFKAYNGEKMTFETPKFNKNKSKVMIRSMILRPGEDAIEVRYMLYKKGDQWRMYDAIVGGLDLVKTYRAQLNEQIAKQGLDKTIQELVNTKL